MHLIQFFEGTRYYQSDRTSLVLTLNGYNTILSGKEPGQRVGEAKSGGESGPALTRSRYSKIRERSPSSVSSGLDMVGERGLYSPDFALGCVSTLDNEFSTEAGHSGNNVSTDAPGTLAEKSRAFVNPYADAGNTAATDEGFHMIFIDVRMPVTQLRPMKAAMVGPRSMVTQW